MGGRDSGKTPSKLARNATSRRKPTWPRKHPGRGGKARETENGEKWEVRRKKGAKGEKEEYAQIKENGCAGEKSEKKHPTYANPILQLYKKINNELYTE